MNKFVAEVTSYIVFLTFLVYDVIENGNNPDRTKASFNGVDDIVIALYVASYTRELIRVSLVYGLKIYKQDLWNIYDLVMTLFFIIAYSAAMVSHVLGERDYECRARWPWYEPTLISEASYSVAIVLAFGRCLYVFKVSSILGPFQVSLSCMVADIMEVFAIFVMAFTAFGMGLCNLYNAYIGMTYITDEGTVREQPTLLARLVSHVQFMKA